MPTTEDRRRVLDKLQGKAKILTPAEPAPDIHITANGGPLAPWVGGALRDAMRFP